MSRDTEVMARWLVVTEFLINAPNLLNDEERAALNRLLRKREKPGTQEKEPRDGWERWAFARRDSEAFRPSLRLWASYLAECERTGECLLTQPTFWAEFKKRPWLRKSRRRFGKDSPKNSRVMGWVGIRT